MVPWQLQCLVLAKKFYDVHDACALDKTDTETRQMCSDIDNDYNTSMKNLFLEHKEAIDEILYGKLPGSYIDSGIGLDN